MDTALGRVGLPKHPATGSVEPYRLPRWGRPEKEQRNLHLFWGKSFWTRNSAMKAELYQWQAGWTREDNQQWEGRMAFCLYCPPRNNCSSMEQMLGPPLPGFLCPNIQERKAILIPDQGSSMLVPLTILHSARAHLFHGMRHLSYGQARRSLTAWSVFFLLLLITPSSWRKLLLLSWCLGAAGTRKLEETLVSPIHCFQQTQVHYLVTYSCCMTKGP